MILDLMIWSPVIVGLILLLIGKNATSLSYWLSLTTSLLVFGMSMYALSMFKTDQVGMQFELIASWIVRQFQNEYNPIHFHGGHLSGAGYIKLPNTFGSSFQKGKSNQHGNINFVHGTGQFMSKGSISYKPKIGDFYIFPNYLYHSVNPFFGKGERRSVSFNAKIDEKIYNVYSSDY